MRLHQVAVRAPDLDVGEAFYRALLGQPAAARFDPPGLVFFVVGEVRLLLERDAPSSLVYLQVDDIAAAITRLGPDVVIRSAGSVIFHHADDLLGPAGTDEVHAFVEDPFGNLVGLVELREG